MCSAVELEGVRYHSIEQLVEAFPVPDEIIDRALAIPAPDGYLVLPIDSCLCVADPEPVLDHLGYRWATDPITGDWIAIR